MIRYLLKERTATDKIMLEPDGNARQRHGSIASF